MLKESNDIDKEKKLWEASTIRVATNGDTKVWTSFIEDIKKK